jgi:hypothetical protein
MAYKRKRQSTISLDLYIEPGNTSIETIRNFKTDIKKMGYLIKNIRSLETKTIRKWGTK